MSSSRIIPILGLLLLLILAIGSLSASDIDSESMGCTDSNDLTIVDEDFIELSDDSNIVGNENIGDAVTEAMDGEESISSGTDGKTGIDDGLSDSLGIVDDAVSDSVSNVDDGLSDSVSDVDTDKISEDKKNNLGANNLASTVKFKENAYSNYFDDKGNLISGKLNSGDTLDFSGSFTNKMFIINIPLVITCTDGTVMLTDCGFKFINGSSGSNISNLKAKQMTIRERSIFEASNVRNLTFRNNDLLSIQSGSHPMNFNSVSNFNIFNNKLQSNGISASSGWGQPSVMVFRNALNCNISGNTVISNDSNGIYFTGYGGSSSMGSNPQDSSTGNYIFNNTVYSIREIPSSFCYAIQLMCKDNIVLNNTVYNAFRGISTTSSGNQIIGNVIHNIHGSFYSQSTEETGADYAIYASSNSIVKDNLIYGCNFKIDDESKGGAIFVSKNSLVSGNIIRNCTGLGINLCGNNVTIQDNNFNVSAFGIYIYGNISDIGIESNIIDSNSQNAIYVAKQSRTLFPHDIIIQNNTLYSTAYEAIYKDNVCTNIFKSNNTIIGESGIPVVDNDTTHIINERNFYNYFSITGSFNNLIKENDTIIFLGSFSSKGKLNINEKVTIQGVSAVFNDTTFIISEIEGITLENITIINPNAKLADRLWGIQISKSNNITVKNCNIYIYDPNSAFAIYVLDSKDCNIINNSLEAKGDYFTVALFSFNSTNILIDGNFLNATGTGATYLCNNQSCLNILAKGVTICPDGTIICPDGTTYGPDDYTICPDGTIICPDGTTICTDGTTICADGTQICADGTIICADGTQICADGTVICSDGSSYGPSEYTTCADGTIICPDGKIICVDGITYNADECTRLENGTIICPDGTQICPDGSVVCPDGTIICVDGRAICPDGTIICADGYRICTDGSVVCPDGTSVAYGDYTTLDDGTIVLNDNTKIYPNGTVVCPDGTVVCPDGYASNVVLDGVIPGTHMISGLFRTYGALFVHSSNVNFTGNAVNVGSSLSPFYNLSESCNTIAGVFIHYGGFNNTISNNNITLRSNDPVVYAMGIVGASSNSSAIGSKNNSFINNNVSLKSVYHGAGIYLGYKAINSTFSNNYFAISAINAYEIVNRTLMENDENIFDGNIFDIISVHFTDLIVSNVSYKWNSGNKIVSITLKDRNGTLIPNQNVFFILDGKNYTGKTNAKGIASVKVAISKLGTFDIMAYFEGAENFIASSHKGKITLTKDSTSLSSPDKTFKVTASAKTISVTLKDSSGRAVANKKVTVAVNGKTYVAYTNSKGQATVKLSLSAVKTYTASIKFVGDSYYTGSSKTIKIKVTKDSSSLSSAGKTYAVTNAGKYISATLKDGSNKALPNKKIIVTVNGKKYYATTNSKGIVKIKLRLNAVKTYKASIKFAGDAYYNACVKSVNVKVIKSKAKLTVPKMTYKNSAKIKKLTATLKDANGKALKSKKITFTVNNKKYTSKTDKRGVATVNVKLSKKNTYKFTVKFAGDKKYVAVKKVGVVLIN